jgi:hypothetical protein
MLCVHTLEVQLPASIARRVAPGWRRLDSAFRYISLPDRGMCAVLLYSSSLRGSQHSDLSLIRR